LLSFLSYTVQSVELRKTTPISLAQTTQQALSVFLQVLHSAQLNRRESHFVFAISRLVKRQLFEWAGREGIVHGPAKKEELRAATHMHDNDFMERHTLLRHFLHRCVANGLLSDGELDLLVQIKLDGNTGDEVAQSNCLSSNAVRQRMKRLLAKLRAIAAKA
jgi:hypothetical protein